jgi:uncharacterized membrane protein
MRRFRIGHHLKTSLWVVPLLFTFGGIALSLAATAIDDGDLVPQSVSGDPHAALQILYLIAFAMLTLTGLVLSLLVVAVQLAMGTFSPRIVRQILQDRPSQCAIGLFAGTFAFSALAMRAVRTTQDGGTVPGLAVVIALVLVLCCIGTLVWYLNHITQSLRTAALVEWVARDTVTTLNRAYPDHGPERELPPDLIAAPTSGVIFTIGYDRLVALAERANCRLELQYGVGDFVPLGSPLVRIVGEPAAIEPAAVTAAIALGPERTLNEDVAYGIRMLVDIAERTLSSGPFEDPTTTVQAIDRLHDILRQIARRPMHSGEYSDAAGVVRVTVPTLQWEGFVRLAFDELRQAGAGSPQVARRLSAALEDLIAVAPAERRPILVRQLAQLHEQAAGSAPTDADRQAVVEPDRAGIGSAAELVAPDAGARSGAGAG